MIYSSQLPVGRFPLLVKTWHPKLPIRIVITFLKALMTHINTAFSFGRRLIVLSGRRTLELNYESY